jgi:hypothetical protein
MKYRRLTLAELEPLKDDFVSFLAINKIDVDAWEKIKSKDIELAEKWIDQFSDIVFEKICVQAEYLQMIESDYHYYLHVRNESVITFRISVKDKINDIAMKTVSHLAENRSQIIFGLLNNGATIADGESFKSASILWAETVQENEKMD